MNLNLAWTNDIEDESDDQITEGLKDAFNDITPLYIIFLVVSLFWIGVLFSALVVVAYILVILFMGAVKLCDTFLASTKSST